MRLHLKKEFLKKSGFVNFELHPLKSDASFRKYDRITHQGNHYILMDDAPPHNNTKKFKEIAEYLQKIHLTPPHILASDVENGFLLLQDFGKQAFIHLLKNVNGHQDEEGIFKAAIDVLLHLRCKACDNILKLPDYDEDILYNEASLFIDWYLPSVKAITVTESARQKFQGECHLLFRKVENDKNIITLRDYHVDNLMQVSGTVIGKDSPLIACGLLDFQDALWGHPAYDLMSILEDARRPMNDDIQKNLLNYYYARAEKDNTPFDKINFMTAYDILAFSRHAKVLGIFARLKYRDNKPHYMKHIPHVEKLFLKKLNSSPLFTPMRQWMMENKIWDKDMTE